MYFDHLVAAPLNRAMSRIPPYSVTSRVLGTAAAFPRLDPSLLTSPLLTDVVSYGLQYNMKDPTKVGYNLSIQRQIATQTAITVAYSGSHSYHQLNGNNGNNALPSEIRNGRKYFPCGVPLQPGQSCPVNALPPRRNPNLGQLQFWVTPGAVPSITPCKSASTGASGPDCSCKARTRTPRILPTRMAYSAGISISAEPCRKTRTIGGRIGVWPALTSATTSP